MSELEFYKLLLVVWFGLAVVVFATLFFVVAPYGRHGRSGWGIEIPEKIGWVVMEFPAPAVFGLLFLLGNRTTNAVALAFLLLWNVHYIHRAFIFPFRRGTSGKRMPLVIVAMGFLFNAVNGYLQSRFLNLLSSVYPGDWLLDPRFIFGALLFAAGFVINLHSDNILLSLRRGGEGGYKIPRGWLFEWVSSPNYLGEIIEWSGWALATFSPAGALFAFWTFANLAPRARANHNWYLQKFPEYPPKRKALIPYLF
ncbi:MAG: DUF1295 domain-containing protein [Myxococcota bacterium]